MRHFLLYQIIEMSDLNSGFDIEIDALRRYRRSLVTYFKDYFCCEPVYMVTSITNNSCYGKIVPLDELDVAARDYITIDGPEYGSDDYEAEYEAIMFNSRLLTDI